MKRGKAEKHMKKILSLLLLSVFLFVSDAGAQVVQPSYVRQAKNPNVQIFDNVLSNGGQSGTNPKVFDVSPFGSAVITVIGVTGGCSGYRDDWEVAPLPQYSKFAYVSALGFLNIRVTESDTPTGTFITSTVENGDHLVNGGDTADRWGTACTFDAFVTLVPMPSAVSASGSHNNLEYVNFQQSRPVVLGGVYTGGSAVLGQVHTAAVDPNGALVVGSSAPYGAATAIAPNSITTVETVYTFLGTRRVTLQNNGTGGLLCAVTSNASLAVDATNYDFSLAASSAVNDGTGGSITLPYIPPAAYYLRCVALSGTAIAAGFAHL